VLTPVVLGVLAVVLAGPLPSLFARWTRLRRTPAAAMLLWQSTALAAVLAALGAGVALATDRLWEPPVGTGDLVVAALAGWVTLVVAGRLLLSGHLTGTTLRRTRRAHRERVDLLARTDGGVSVLEHERSHLRARHDLVLEAFTVLHRAFPRFVASGAARREVEVLVEVLADRAAVRRADRRALVSALLVLAGAPSPAGSLGAAASALAARVEVLRDTGSHRVQAVAVGVLAVALLALPTLLVVVPWVMGLEPR
jgi:hypothetical protein